MNNNELASEFVKKYPNMFYEDKDFWIHEIIKLLNESNAIMAKNLINKLDKEDL